MSAEIICVGTELLLGDIVNTNAQYISKEMAKLGIDLYYHTWEKENSSHYYEVDFLLASKTKIVPIEVKSSGIGKHESITEFQKKYSKHVSKEILLSQKDIGNSEMLKLYPIYMLPFLIEEL